MKVRLSPEVGADLRDIGFAIAKDSPSAATRLIRRLRTACVGLNRFPRRHPVDETVGCRKFVVGQYLIFYRIMSAEVQVVRVLHGARDYAPVLSGTDEED
jgi:plasmid stabilization system protein ParE